MIDHTDRPAMMVVTYQGNESLIFANNMRKTIKASIGFNTSELKPAYHPSSPLFRVNLNPKYCTRFHVLGVKEFDI